MSQPIFFRLIHNSPIDNETTRSLIQVMTGSHWHLCYQDGSCLYVTAQFLQEYLNYSQMLADDAVSLGHSIPILSLNHTKNLYNWSYLHHLQMMQLLAIING